MVVMMVVRKVLQMVAPLVDQLELLMANMMAVHLVAMKVDLLDWQ